MSEEMPVIANSLLETIAEEAKNCTLCAICKTRDKIVVGKGNSSAKLVIIGDCPNIEDDKTGEAFTGKVGLFVENVLKAFKIDKGDIYFANIVKCHTQNNREPVEEEIKNCKPFLVRQLSAIKPKLILCLGRVASNALLNTNAKNANELRNKVHDYQIDEDNQAKVICTWHPAHVMKNPDLKKAISDDFKLLRDEMDKEFQAEEV